VCLTQGELQGNDGFLISETSGEGVSLGTGTGRETIFRLKGETRKQYWECRVTIVEEFRQSEEWENKAGGVVLDS